MKLKLAIRGGAYDVSRCVVGSNEDMGKFTDRTGVMAMGMECGIVE